MARAKAKTAVGTDAKTMELISMVARQKAEISKAERPNWKTNCLFYYVEGRAADSVNLHVEADVRKLIQIAAFLQEREASYNRAAVALGVESSLPFTWGGHSLADWMEDLKSRIGKVQIGAKRKKLEAMEARLNAIISPELRAKLELEAIEAELG